MEKTIRRRLLSYLSGRVTLADLHARLLAETWDLDERRRPAVARLAYSSLLAIAEYEQGHITESELRNRLASLAHTAFFGDPTRTVTGSGSLTQRTGWTARMAQPRLVAADRRSEAVYA